MYAEVGGTYSQTNAAAVYGSNVYSVSTGSVPAGTTLNTATGTVSGMPRLPAPFLIPLK